MTKEQLKNIDLANKRIGEIRTENTRQSIKDCIENWDFNNDGKITQLALAKKIGKGKATLNRYWSEFKNQVKTLNTENNMFCDKTMRKNKKTDNTNE